MRQKIPVSDDFLISQRASFLVIGHAHLETMKLFQDAYFTENHYH